MSELYQIDRLPRVIIQYCSKCKWQNRAVWYATELLQTFEDSLKDISLQPIVDQPGAFQVLLQKPNETIIVYKRRFKSKELALKYGDIDGSQLEIYYYDGFPDSKLLKVLIRDLLDESVSLGHHIDKFSGGLAVERNKQIAEAPKVSTDTTGEKDNVPGEPCDVCKTEE